MVKKILNESFLQKSYLIAACMIWTKVQYLAPKNCKVHKYQGLVFLIHCCNIYGNSEGFHTLLGYTLPKQKTSWARSTIQPMAILSVPLKSYMAKVAPKIKKEFLRTFNFWIITEPFIGKRNWFFDSELLLSNIEEFNST